MGVLKNPRWELVAQNLAKGMTQNDAYRGAGYKGNEKTIRAAANKLIECHPEIQCRTDELLARRAAHDIKAGQMALKELALDKQYTLRAAHENLEIALGRKMTKKTRTHSTVVAVPSPLIDEGNGPYTPVECVSGRWQHKTVDTLVVKKAEFEGYDRDGAVAARMIELIGREHGLFIETKRFESDPLDSIPPESLGEVIDMLKDALTVAKKRAPVTIDQQRKH